MFYDHINRYVIRRKNYARLAGKYKKEGDITLVMKGREVGFFSIFFQVIGALDYCCRNNINLIVDFEKGPYFEEEAGSNWWAYYFDNNEFFFGTKNSRFVTVDDTWSQKVFSYYGRTLSPIKAYRYVKQVGVRSDFQKESDDFFSRDNRPLTCGVHYRGTDKVSGSGKEATKIPYDFVADQLMDISSEHDFFIATDEQQFLAFIRDRFLDRVLYRDVFRSVDDTPIHNGVDGYSMYKAGAEALIDCLILSQCSILLRTDSNLSYACRFFNPRQKNVNITDNYLKVIGG